MVPHGVYQCVGDDMWTAISVSSADEWLGLCQAIGQPDLAFDPRFEERNTRRDNQDELDEIITAWTMERDHYQVMHFRPTVCQPGRC